MGNVWLQRIAQEREKLGEGEQPEEPVDSKKATPLSAAWCVHWTHALEVLFWMLRHMAQASWLMGCVAPPRLGRVASFQGCQLLALDSHCL